MARFVLLFVALLVSLPLAASAQIPTITEVAISCATDSTVVRAAETLPTRRLNFKLINDSDTVIYASEDGNAAAVNTGIRLNANGGAYVSDMSVSQNAINCIHGGSGTKTLLGVITTLTP